MICWIVVEDGLTGTQSQCVGVAEALGVQPIIKNFTLKWPWKKLSPYLTLGIDKGYVGADLQAPWPDLLIVSGRKAIGLGLWIKRASRGKTFVVCLQDPRVHHNQFDLIAVPAHDPARGANVVVTTGAPNKITPEKLALAADKWAPVFEKLPRPRVAVLVGGQSRAYTMNGAIANKLGDNLKKIARDGKVGLMVTTSRRTGVHNTAILEAWLEGTNAYIWDGIGNNPYQGFLALADAIIVSADSVSMISEAATTGKPVYRVDLDGGSTRLSAFHKIMEEQGIVRPFHGQIENWSYIPLNDAAIVASAIKERMNV
jgi:mitochondrial fission protein ELM1